MHYRRLPTDGKALVRICNAIMECYNALTACHCSVSIKVIKGDSDHILLCDSIDSLYAMRVENIARDTNHQGSRDTEEYQAISHIIISNTSFASVIGRLKSGKEPFYRCKDVNINNGYETTSPYRDEDGNTSNPPYQSELVVPIYRSNEQSFSFRGFLCIDAEEKDAFKSDKMLVELAFLYANMLFMILDI